MAIKFTEDIRSVTDVKRNTKEILEQIHRTRRPVVVTVNGRADAVLVDAETYQKRLSAERLARLISPAEEDIANGRSSPMRAFMKEFKRARGI
jgi:prevent-host-death family protein